MNSHAHLRIIIRFMKRVHFAGLSFLSIQVFRTRVEIYNFFLTAENDFITRAASNVICIMAARYVSKME